MGARFLKLAQLSFESVEGRWMMEALRWAKEAQRAGEVPVGAVLVNAEGAFLAGGANRVFGDFDPTAHAEVVVLREAMRRLRATRGSGLRLYVTLQPCWMCLAALMHASVSELVFLLPTLKVWPTFKRAWQEEVGGFYRLEFSKFEPGLRWGGLQVRRLFLPQLTQPLQEQMVAYFKRKRLPAPEMESRQCAFECDDG